MNDRPRPPQLAESGTTLARGVFATLGAPSAWMLDLLVSYAVRDLLCDSDADQTTVRVVLVIVSAVALLLAVSAGLTAATVRRQRGDADPAAPEGGRQRLLATVGLLLSLVFGVAILLTLASALFAGPC